MLFLDTIRRKIAEAFVAGFTDGAKECGLIDPDSEQPVNELRLFLANGELRELPEAKNKAKSK